MITRREFMAGTLALGAAAGSASLAAQRRDEMYGLIGRMQAKPGQREALIAILIDGVSRMPGCLSYIVARDTTDPDAIWITEVWDSRESHAASLTLPAVKDAIAKGRPLIAGMDRTAETTPVGGHGLVAASA